MNRSVSRPRQNRVTPLGEIIATPARGTLMGNRGCLHDEQGTLKRLYQTKRWIICQLQFKNRRRAIMTPGKYTELFFLDEATALAAGHRPCAECARPRFNQFVAVWIQVNPEWVSGPRFSADKLDGVLHSERLSKGQKVAYPELLGNLPVGTFITFADKQPVYLVLEKSLRAWHPEGYGNKLPRPDSEIVQVLTPRSTVKALAAGYPVDIHHSAFEG